MRVLDGAADRAVIPYELAQSVEIERLRDLVEEAAASLILAAEAYLREDA